MGVPKFYRFISERYPLINSKVHPHGAPRIDNLYLDMNGIIHNCNRSSPGPGGPDTKRYTSSAPVPRTIDQIFLDVMKYVDNIFALVPPSKLLYMAIDGVAPRAKMNQQRARRFRSAKEHMEEHERLMAEDPMYVASSHQPFDSNCITPGTEFMQRLTEALKYFVSKKITEDRRWQNISVVLSGAEVPGEGEHKIMEYIRAVRESGALHSNTRHCVYGLDADLIMLGLVTHEPHFFILREKIDYGALWKKKGGPRVATSLDTAVFGEFVFLSIGVLREYLVLELGEDGNSTLPYFDVERLSDDFVFILMLIGNDFLPHLPSLEIATGTLGVMLHLYKRVLPLMGGYLTKEGKIIPERLDYFFAKLGMLDKDAMKNKNDVENQAAKGRRRSGRSSAIMNVDLDKLFGFGTFNPNVLPNALTLEELRREAEECRLKVNDKELRGLKRAYYDQKFEPGFGDEGSEGMKELIQCFVEGIWWTLRYYAEGCRHWRWFYRYHYAPLASDLYDVASNLEIYEQTKFVPDEPFRPLEQLLSVLPPVSSWCLPKPHRALMNHPSSPIREFYPEQFDVDMNGKRNDWEAVVLLPFVDENQLHQAIKTISPDSMTSYEAERNKHGTSFVYRYCSTWAQEHESPFNKQLPSLISKAKRMELKLPSLPAGKAFTARVLPGTQMPTANSLLSDIPTLGTFPLRARLASAGVNIFGTPSKSETLLLELTFGSNIGGSRSANNASDLSVGYSVMEWQGLSIGSPVWFGYPWRSAGQINYIMTADFTQRLTVHGRLSYGHGSVAVDVRQTNKAFFDKEVNIMVSDMAQKKGVVFTAPAEVVGVQGLSDSDTKTSAENGGDHYNNICHPLFVKPRDSSEVSRDVLQATNEHLVDGQPVLYIGSGPFFGFKAVVRAILSNGLVKVEFDTPELAAKEPAFGYRVVSISTSNQRWMTLSKLAGEVKLPVQLVDYFLGSVRVRLMSGKQEIDLGLGIKYIGRALYVPGYARPDERSFYSFSDQTVDLLRRYKATFPHLFSCIGNIRANESRTSTVKSNGPVVHTSKDLFGNVPKADDAARAASTWLSVQEVANLPLISTNSTVLPKTTVAELEKHASIAISLQDDFKKTFAEKTASKTTKEVTRQSVLTGGEGLHWGLGWTSFPAKPPVSPDASTVRLGDRVVNRLSEGSVPFGLRGTVVGIHPGTYSTLDTAPGAIIDPGDAARVEVVFDEGFIGGSTLNGRCTDGRGKAVAAHLLFIVRPDRDNEYYARHYAQIAARMGSASQRSGAVEAGFNGRGEAIAKASMLSYADVVKKANRRETNVVRMNGTDVVGLGGERRQSASNTRFASGQSSVRMPNAVAVGLNGSGTQDVRHGIEGSLNPATLPLPKFVRGRHKSRGGNLSVVSQSKTVKGKDMGSRSRAQTAGQDNLRTGTSEMSSDAMKQAEDLAALWKKDMAITNHGKRKAKLNGRNGRNVTNGVEGGHNDRKDEDEKNELVSTWEQLQKEAKLKTRDQKN